MKITIEINGIPVKAFLYGRSIMVNVSDLVNSDVLKASYFPKTLNVGGVEYEFKERVTAQGDPLTPSHWVFSCTVNTLQVLNL